MTIPEIKSTTSDDIPSLQRVLDETGLFSPDLLPDLLTPALDGLDPALWLSCHHGGAVVGFCFTAPEEMAAGAWNMRAIAVRPALQGHGFGSALVKAVEQHLQATRQRILIVDTSGTDDYALTRKFYVRNGYVEEARIRDFWAEGDDKVVFRKALRL